MLFGISHIAITTNPERLGNLKSLLNALGYKVDFVEKNLINSSYKNEFLSKRNKIHDITYLKCKGRISIEIVAYKNVVNLPNNCIISLSGKLDKNDQVIFNYLSFKVFYNSLHGIKYVLDQNNKLILPANNPKDEVLFWSNLGFSSEFGIVNVKSPVQSWTCDIFFMEKSSSNSLYLDNCGVNVLSIATSGIEKYSHYRNVVSTEIINLKVNNKEMSIVLLKRAGYNIEFMEIK